jgi:enamine deaminase RidA (YjgF/YER057c/UK114 family)
MTPDARLIELGLELPPPPSPGGTYVSAKRVGELLFLAGAISSGPGGVITGVVGQGATVPDGYAAARACALNHLAVIRRELGSLDAVAEVVSLNGYVNSVAGFTESPAVINGASDLLVELFGEAGRHVRAAVGVSGLPRGAMVETQMTVRVKA